MKGGGGRGGMGGRGEGGGVFCMWFAARARGNVYDEMGGVDTAYSAIAG